MLTTNCLNRYNEYGIHYLQSFIYLIEQYYTLQLYIYFSSSFKMIVLHCCNHCRIWIIDLIPAFICGSMMMMVHILITLLLTLFFFGWQIRQYMIKRRKHLRQCGSVGNFLARRWLKKGILSTRRSTSGHTPKERCCHSRYGHSMWVMILLRPTKIK